MPNTRADADADKAAATAAEIERQGESLQLTARAAVETGQEVEPLLAGGMIPKFWAATSRNAAEAAPTTVSESIEATRRILATGRLAGQ